MTVPKFRAAKGTRRLSMLTAYDAPTAGLFEDAGVDAILVGDSVATAVQGRDDTLGVTLDEIIYHTTLVGRAVDRVLLVADMPFLSYQASVEQAVLNSGRVIKETPAAAVKVEGGTVRAETIARLTAEGIPVMAHIGLQPQSVRQLGGYRVEREEGRLLGDARAVEQAGAFAVVLELVPGELAERITGSVSIPTIGIGAGPGCDGQVLVGPDMLGMSDFSPKFLKRYADLRTTIREAARAYVEDVASGTYPAAEHTHDA
ncbi:MAG: 3-methyl-2-oxobutanoate hydroxymethyltransferase [Planctomycetota bacterium]